MTITEKRPSIAIIDTNTLAMIGLKQLLQTVMPIVDVAAFNSMSELEANHPEQFVHFFVSMEIVLEHRLFFTNHRRKTIVLTTSSDVGTQLPEFHSICTNVPERELVRSLLALEQHAMHTARTCHQHLATCSRKS